MNELICRGDRVVDNDGNEGIVVKINKGYDQDDHGTIVVWQLNRDEYGADNCEHYPEFNWQDSLIVINEKVSKFAKLIDVCRSFIDEHKIGCAESIYQVDNNVIDAPKLVEEICNIIGYYE